MTIQLTEQQQKVLDSAGATPPQFVDPRTKTEYVLIPATEYETAREILENEREQTAIREIALENAVGHLDELLQFEAADGAEADER